MSKFLKLVFNPGNHNSATSLGLFILRVSSGFLMLTHGYGKFLKFFSDDPIKFADPIGIGVTASLALAVFAEFFCSIFIIVGFATRFSAIPLFITMLVAAAVVHVNDPLSDRELSMLYAGIFFLIALSGAGKLSVDAQISKY